MFHFIQSDLTYHFNQSNLSCIPPENLLKKPDKIALEPLSHFRRWNISEDTVDLLKLRETDDEQFDNLSDLGFLTLDQMPEFLEPPTKIKFGVESLDNLTRGGIDFSTITEIYGEGGSGKTQICLQLALNVQLKSTSGQCVYISAGKMFPANRIQQMADEMKKCAGAKCRKIKFLDSIHVLMAYNVEIFENFIKEELQEFLVAQSKSRSVKLLIIDSIADIYREDHDFKKRAVSMRETLTKLTDLAKQFKFAIVCTNHAVDVIDDDDEESFNILPISNIKPALGLVWHSIVSTSLEVRRTERKFEDQTIREMKLIETQAALPLNTEQFIITQQGISD